MIDSYSFGRIVIEGQQYTSDIIIYPEGKVESNWWRKNGHRLIVDDIKGLINANPDVIIAGTGASGLMTPTDELKNHLAKKGIEFIALPSKKAATYYNTLSGQKKVGACFHLTC